MEKYSGETSRKISVIQIDNIREYKDQFLRFGKSNRIGKIGKHGMAKELNRYLLEKVQYLLSNAQLDKSF